MTYPPVQKRKKSKLLAVVLVSLGVFVLCACGAGGYFILSAPSHVTVSNPESPLATPPPSQENPEPSPSLPAKASAPAAAAPKPAAVTIEDGTWTVGEDFPAGIYRANGAGADCYWAIYKSGTNQSGIVDNHLGAGNLRVTLKKGQDFETDGCGTWVKQ